jgi:hypothetical protein
MGSHRAYEIAGVKVGRFVLNGVYEDAESGNAWLGQVFTYEYEDAQDVQLWPGPGGGALPAPDDWEVRVVRFLGAYE